MPDAGAARERGGTARRGRMAYAISLLAAIAAGAAVVTAFAVARAHGGQPARPSGIPASVTGSQVNLMGLAPVPGKEAPRFLLTDQNGHVISLSRLRGKVVVLEFMDPHCTDICPIVSAEYLDAYRDLGAAAGDVVFAAVNVNQYHASVSDMMAYSREQNLLAIPDWHFLTGPVPSLRAVWDGYGVTVQAPNPGADIVHTSVIYFIGPDGRERFVASPADDHAKNGTAFLPSGQLAAWGTGIARVARTLAG